MKSKTMILMALAVACGLAASLLTRSYLKAQEQTVQVLVANANYTPYTQIKNAQDQFSLKEMLRNEAPRDALQSYDDLVGKILVKGLTGGEPVTSQCLQDRSKVGLDAVIQPGHRCVAIRTTAETVVSGLVLPMSRVDVYAARRTDKDAECKVILQNILVRSVDTTITRPDDRTGVVPSTVTVEVTPEQAITLQKNKAMGADITLALRPINDEKIIPDLKLYPKETEVKPVAVVKAAEPAKVVVAPPQPRGPKVDKSYKMMIYNGSQWIRATHKEMSNGERMMEVERSQGEGGGPAPTQVAAAAPAGAVPGGSNLFALPPSKQPVVAPAIPLPGAGLERLERPSAATDSMPSILSNLPQLLNQKP